MAQAIFDALACSETLQAAGIPQEQANALARAQKAAMSQIAESGELAGKRDLLELELRLTRSMEAMQKENLKFIVNAMIAQTSITIAAIGIGVALVAWLLPR